MSHSDAEIREQLNKILKSSSSTDMYSTEYSAEDYVKMFDSLLALIEEQTRLARKEGWIDGYHTGCDKSVESRHQKHNQRCKKEGK